MSRDYRVLGIVGGSALAALICISVVPFTSPASSPVSSAADKGERLDFHGMVYTSREPGLRGEVIWHHPGLVDYPNVEYRLVEYHSPLNGSIKERCAEARFSGGQWVRHGWCESYGPPLLRGRYDHGQFVDAWEVVNAQGQVIERRAFTPDGSDWTVIDKK